MKLFSKETIEQRKESKDKKREKKEEERKQKQNEQDIQKLIHRTESLFSGIKDKLKNSQIQWFLKMEPLKESLMKKNVLIWNKIEEIISSTISVLKSGFPREDQININSPHSAWRNTIERLVELIGLESISTAFHASFSLEDGKFSEQHSREALERIRRVIEEIEDINIPLAFYAKIGSIAIRLEVDRTKNPPEILSHTDSSSTGVNTSTSSMDKYTVL